jgi:acetylglutamate kinase
MRLTAYSSAWSRWEWRAPDIAPLRTIGAHPAVVHGGGPMISAMLDRLGIATRFRAGPRVTSPEAMQVVEVGERRVGTG